MANISASKLVSLKELMEVMGGNKELEIFGHNSSTSFHEFLSTLYLVKKERLQSEIMKFKYFGIIVDDSTDSSRKTQMSIFIKYLDKMRVVK
jgi:hypothetical protein